MIAADSFLGRILKKIPWFDGSNLFRNVSVDDRIHFAKMSSAAKNGNISLIYFFCKQHKKSIIFFQILCLTWAIEEMVWPFILRYTVNALEKISPDRSDIMTYLFWPIAITMMAWITIDLMFRTMYFIRSYVIRPALDYNMTQQLTAKIFGHDYQFFVNNAAGGIVGRIFQFADSSLYILSSAMETCVPAVVGSLLSVCSFYYINFYLGVVVTLYVFIQVWIIVHYGKKSASVTSSSMNARHSLVSKTLDVIYNIMTVKSFASTHRENLRLDIARRRNARVYQLSLTYLERMRLAMTINGIIILGFIFAAVEIVAFKNHMINVADFAYSFSALTALLGMNWIASEELITVLEHLGRCKNDLDFIFSSKIKTEAIFEGDMNVTDGRIAFHNVYFRHQDGEKDLFTDKSMIIEGKKKVGLVGLSGSGKTTFVNLISGVYRPKSGKITIDDQNITKYSPDSLRKNIATIPQDCALFDRTILDNIRYGKPEATFEEVVDAAKKSHAHDFIMKMTHGYHTLVAEKGAKMSGGQRQRIAIARAFIKDAKILILDEATSALDKKTEQLIRKSLNQIMIGKTVLVIAHRLDTLVDMDEILVFDSGKIVERGTHQELMKIPSGHYVGLWNFFDR